jgi:hypothetical protein
VSGVFGSSFRPWLERSVSFPVYKLILPQEPAGVKGASRSLGARRNEPSLRPYFRRAIFRESVQPSIDSLTK